MFRKSKPSQKYCLGIAKQIAALMFQKLYSVENLGGRTCENVTLIWKNRFSHHFLDAPFSGVSFSVAVEN